VVQQQVGLAQPFEDRFARRQPFLRPSRFERRKAQLVGHRLVDQLRQPAQVDRAVDAVQRVLRRPNCVSRNCDNSCGQVATTSSRIAWP